MRRIGVLMNLAADDAQSMARIAAFLQGLQQLGWTDGRNVVIDYRWGAGDHERIRKSAAGTGRARTGRHSGRRRDRRSWPLQQVSRTVPIVFGNVTDPVGAGIVASLARPGGNTTGFTNFEYGISAKWLELLKQIAPGTTRAAVLRDPTLIASMSQFAAIQSVAPSLGVELMPIDTRNAGDIERSVATFAREPNSGLIVVTGTVGDHPSRADHLAGGPAPNARGLPVSLLRHRRRLDLLRA